MRVGNDTLDQKEVWCFPSYEFMVHKDSLSVVQVGGSFYYMRIGLIELVDLNCLASLPCGVIEEVED